MANVSATLNLKFAGKYIGANDLGVPALPFIIEESVTLNPNVTGASNHADTAFLDERTLASNTTENIDLAGVLTDAFGTTIANAEAVMIVIKAAAGNTTNLTFFGAASNAFNGPLSGTTPKVTLGPGEFFAFSSTAGWAVTAGTGDILLVANSAGASATYKIAIIGRTIAA